jgi:hypothetical protein
LSSASIGELWLDVDKLDGAAQEGASMWSYRQSLPPGPSSGRSNRGTEDDAMHATGRALLDDALRPSFALPRGYGGGSVRNKAMRILSDAPGVVSPCMRRSFVDRRYLPSTSMDPSEWEIILEECTHMGYIVKQEPVDETDN